MNDEYQDIINDLTTIPSQGIPSNYPNEEYDSFLFMQ